MSPGDEIPPTEGSESTDEPLSSQAIMISNALREADKLDQSVYEANDVPEEREASVKKEAESSLGDCTAMTGAANTHTTTTLNLKENDTQFLVLSEVILGMYGHLLTNGATSFSVSLQDKVQLDRMMKNRDAFVDAVRFRLRFCPEDSSETVHVAVRNCRALGLHRSEAQNPLFASVGTLIPIEVRHHAGLIVEKPEISRFSLQQPQNSDDIEDGTMYAFVTTNGDSPYDSVADSATQLQLTAELREASKLMADSATPEAVQFWRRHVVELQTRLRNLNVSGKDSISGETERLLRNDDTKLLPLLCQNSGYVPPQNDELSQLPEIKERSQISRPGVSAPITNGLSPELEGFPMVDVVAPANLPEGYTFEAEIDGCRFMATVPAGGVKKGQAFTCYMRDVMNDNGAPTHRWRDGIFDCFRYGVLHPMALNSIFCPLRKCILHYSMIHEWPSSNVFCPVGLSQVMTRMGTDYVGLPPKNGLEKGSYSTRGMALMIFGLWLLLNAIFVVAFLIKKNTETPISMADIFSCVGVNVGMYVYVAYATANARAVLRRRYQIKEFCCSDDVEDMVCAVACMPCVVSQMGRHTVSYIEHRGVCCSETGLEPGVMAELTARSHQGSYRVW